MKTCMRTMVMICLWGIMAAPIAYAQSISLEEAIKMAKTNNPELKIAQFDLSIMENTISQNRSDVLPKINFITDKTDRRSFVSQLVYRDNRIVENFVPVDTNLYDMKVTLEQKIVDFSYLSHAAALHLQYEAARSALQQKEADVAFNTVTKYYTLVKLEQMKKVMENDIALLEAYVHDIRTKQDLKFEDREKVITIEINLQSKKQALYKHNQEYYDARVTFAQLLLLPLTLDFQLSDFDELAQQDVSDMQVLSAKKAFDMALNTRHDMAQLHYTWESFIKERRSLKKAYFPSLSLQGSLGYLQKDTFPSPSNQEDQYWNITARAACNLFNGFSQSLKIEETDLKSVRTYTEIEIMKKQIESDIDRIIFYLQVMKKMHDDATYHIKIAEENLDIVKEKVALEQNTKEDLLGASLTYNNAKLEYVQAKSDFLLTYKKYEYIIGVLE